MNDTIPIANRKVLLGKHTCRRNKIHLIIGWTHFRHWYIDWKWAGEEFKSRMLFRFGPDEAWIQAESFEEDLPLPCKNAPAFRQVMNCRSQL